MRRRAAAPAGVPGPVALGAAVLGAAALGMAVLAGCATARTPYRATAATCYAFSVQALGQHRTVTTTPRACAGLSHEQIDLAVARAVRTVVGPHGKVAGRRLAHREIGYLARLIHTAQPAGPVPQAGTTPGTEAGAAAGRSPSLPLGLAALAAWAVTVAAGAWLIAGWLTRGGLRRRGARAGGVPRTVVAGHVTFALAGLGVWIAFLVTGVAALAWAAVGVILVIAGLGMATLAGGLPSAPPTAGLDPPEDPPPVAAPASAATLVAVLDRPAGVRTPLLVIVLHGALAATTILLVVLATVGAG